MGCPLVHLVLPLCSWLAQLVFDMRELHLVCLTSIRLLQSPLPCLIGIEQDGFSWLDQQAFCWLAM